MDFKKTHEYITSRQFNPSKKMGQNFLVNEEISKKIVEKIDLSKANLVIEIGPGLGSLTDHLIDKKFDLVLIELDKRLNEFLVKRYKDKKMEIINSDVLKVDFNQISKGYKHCVIVSNLPYSISSLVVMKFLKSSNIDLFYCMLQKEMVDRIMAPISSKKYNGLTALATYYFNIERLMNISPNNFYPIPEVDSTFIKIKKNNKIYDEKFDKFLRTCFLNRRKTLINNLKHTYKIDQLNLVINSLNFKLTSRAEEFTPEQLHTLYTTLNNEN